MMVLSVYGEDVSMHSISGVTSDGSDIDDAIDDDDDDDDVAMVTGDRQSPPSSRDDVTSSLSAERRADADRSPRKPRTPPTISSTSLNSPQTGSATSRPRDQAPGRSNNGVSGGKNALPPTAFRPGRLTNIEILERIFPLQKRHVLELVLTGCNGDLVKAIEQFLSVQDTCFVEHHAASSRQSQRSAAAAAILHQHLQQQQQQQQQSAVSAVAHGTTVTSRGSMLTGGVQRAAATAVLPADMSQARA